MAIRSGKVFARLLIAAFLCLVGARAACTNVTNLSYSALNPRTHALGIASFNGQFSDGRLVLAAGQAVRFAFNAPACLQAIAWSGAGSLAVAVTDNQDRVTVHEFDDGSSDASVQIATVQQCNAVTFAVKASAGAASLAAIEYCDAAATVHGAVGKRRSMGDVSSAIVDDAIAEDADTHTSADAPIVPVAYCNSRLSRTLDGDEWCLAIFSYESANNYTVTLNATYVHFVQAQNATAIAPVSFYAGGTEASIGVIWLCTPRTHTSVQLVIDTPMTANATQRMERHVAELPRNARVKCGDDIVDWFTLA